MTRMISELFKRLIYHSERIQTKHNGIVEINYSPTAKVLDSNTTNYSYGLLQKVLEKGLSKVNFDDINSILILGLGGGSVIESIRKISDKPIIAIDIDEDIIRIAKDEFKINKYKDLDIICADANDYISGICLKFDLVIIDLFIDDSSPIFLKSSSFWDKISSLSPKYIIFNSSVRGLKFDKAIISDSFPKSSIDIIEGLYGENELLVVKQEN